MYFTKLQNLLLVLISHFRVYFSHLDQEANFQADQNHCFINHFGRDRIVVRFTTTHTISAYHHQSCEFAPCSWRGVLNTTLCDKVCQWLATGRWFSPDTSVSSIIKTNRHDITEILLKLALNTTNLNPDFSILNSDKLLSWTLISCYRGWIRVNTF